MPVSDLSSKLAGANISRPIMRGSKLNPEEIISSDVSLSPFCTRKNPQSSMTLSSSDAAGFRVISGHAMMSLCGLCVAPSSLKDPLGAMLLNY